MKSVVSSSKLLLRVSLGALPVTVAFLLPEEPFKTITTLLM
jgi:hypothetical protein